MENEIWKPVVGYKGLYEVSNLGRVRGLKNRWGLRESPIILSPHLHHDGYPLVRLCNGAKCTTKKVHRLLAEAFIPNPGNKPCIDHIDGNPANNYISNLRWCTMKENMNNPVSLERHRTANAKSTRKLWARGVYESVKRPVYQMDDNGIIRRWSSITEASTALHLCGQDISQVCKGRRSSCGGYKWQYAL